MCASLLGSIARYGVSRLRDAREDRLTGVCAAVFDDPRCAGLAHTVALGWLERATEQSGLPNWDVVRTIRDLLADPRLSWSCRTQTQLRLDTDEGDRRPDLELRLTGTDPDGVPTDVVLWIEVKHGTPPHSQQLLAYVHEQVELPNAAVLLVAPRDQIPTFDQQEIPPEVPQLTWEETAELIKRYEPCDAIGEFLVGELCRYLREEGLMDPDQLTPVHLVALANHHEAVHALERLCDIADEEVCTRWNDRRGHNSWPRGDPQVSWWNYPTHSRDSKSPLNSGAWYCEWVLRRNAADVWSNGRPGVPCFTTGITAAASAGAIAALGELARANIERAAVELVQAKRPDGHDRIQRRAYPEEALAGADLVRQDRALANWIIDGFNLLSTALQRSL